MGSSDLLTTGGVIEVGRRYCRRAYRRYGWNRRTLDDAREVGKYLLGHVETIAILTARYDENGTVYSCDGSGRYRFIDVALCSLMDTLLSWRQNAAAGRLKSHMPIPAPIGEVESMANLADFLLICGMFGERAEYEYPSRAETFDAMHSLPGWTWGRIGELYALADENFFKHGETAWQ